MIPESTLELDLTVRQMRRWLNDRIRINRARRRINADDAEMTADLELERLEIRSLHKALESLCSYTMGQRLPINSIESRLMRGEGPERAADTIKQISTIEDTVSVLDFPHDHSEDYA